MVLLFEGSEPDVHRFLVYSFHESACIPDIAAPYLLLAENTGPRSPSTHTALYAGESARCRQRCASHSRTREKFSLGAQATVSGRFDTGEPALVLIPENWQDFVTPTADPRAGRAQYEEKLKFLFSPICDFQAAHLTAHRGGRRFRPGNHLVSIHSKAGRMTYARPMLGFRPQPLWRESRLPQPSDPRHA